MAVHIGEIIQKEVKRQHLSEGEFANLINTTRTNVYDIYKRPDFKTGHLRDIGKALGINIFKLISKEMEEDMAKSAGEGEFLESVGKLRRHDIFTIFHLWDVVIKICQSIKMLTHFCPYSTYDWSHIVG